MFAQLGNIIFTGLFGFNDLSFEGDEVNYSEFALVNNKPSMQSVGISLIEISATVTMNVSFCKVNDQLRALNDYKKANEVLPLLLGDGQFLGYFVIVSNPYSIDEAFADGTYKQITLRLSLKEYHSINKLEQKQMAAKKSAFAVGDKKPIVLRTPQPQSIEKDIANNITATKQAAESIDNLTEEIKKTPDIKKSDKILKAAKKAKNDIDKMKDQIEKKVAEILLVEEIKDVDRVLVGVLNEVKNSSTGLSNDFERIGNIYPFSDVSILESANTSLQASSRSFNTSANGLMKNITIRR